MRQLGDPQRSENPYRVEANCRIFVRDCVVCLLENVKELTTQG